LYIDKEIINTVEHLKGSYIKEKGKTQMSCSDPVILHLRGKHYKLIGVYGRIKCKQ